jgi:hypothetical protein
MLEQSFCAYPRRAIGAFHAAAHAVLVLAGVMLCLSASGGSRGKPLANTLANARQEYLGAKVRITGPLKAPSAGILRIYVNWLRAKKRASGRYEPETDADWGLLSYGAERSQATIIAIQLSTKQRKGPWVDFMGNRHEADELGPDLDFIVRFDEGGSTAMCTSSLETVSSCFNVVASKPASKN